MRQMTEEQQKKRQRTLEWQFRNRWKWTALWLFFLAIQTVGIFEKRSQLPHLLLVSPWHIVPVWQWVWLNISTCILIVFSFVQLWVRIHNYRREQIAVEQEALRKAAPPTDRVWPPPPVL